MSTLREQLQADLNVALKARNELATTTLRSVLGAIQTAEKSGKTAKVFSDAEVLDQVKRAVKTRRESVTIYTDAGATDRAEREAAEADLLDTYLPAQLTEVEVDALVSEVIAGFESAPTQRDFGVIMKAVLAKADGATDGKVVSALVKARLQG